MIDIVNRIYELVKVYNRMLNEAEEEDDRRLVSFFMGCQYAAHVIYEEAVDWEIEQEDE